MTPDQRLHFCCLLKNAKLTNTCITVDEIASIVGITHEEVKQPWHIKIKLLIAFEHDYQWVVYVKENPPK